MEIGKLVRVKMPPGQRHGAARRLNVYAKGRRANGADGIMAGVAQRKCKGKVF